MAPRTSGPIDRFARETLTPLGNQPSYHYTAPRRRIVAADALVAIAAGRYSVSCGRRQRR